MRRIVPLVLAAGLFGLAAAPASADKPITYNVALTNCGDAGIACNPDDGDPNTKDGAAFTPRLWAVHEGGHRFFKPDRPLFRPDEPCTYYENLIAEDAANALFDDPMSQCLRQSDWVGASGTDGPLILPGQTDTFQVTSDPENGIKRISVLAMLIPTNDAITGFTTGLGQKTFFTSAYDAGTENNNEDPDFLPGPPASGFGFGNFFVPDPTYPPAPVTLHPGLDPNGPLADFQWGDPVMKVEITRVPAAPPA